MRLEKVAIHRVIIRVCLLFLAFTGSLTAANQLMPLVGRMLQSSVLNPKIAWFPNYQLLRKKIMPHNPLNEAESPFLNVLQILKELEERENQGVFGVFGNLIQTSGSYLARFYGVMAGLALTVLGKLGMFTVNQCDNLPEAAHDYCMDLGEYLQQFGGKYPSEISNWIQETVSENPGLSIIYTTTGFFIVASAYIAQRNYNAGQREAENQSNAQGYRR